MPSQTRTRRFVGLTAFFAFHLVLAAGAMAQDESKLVMEKLAAQVRVMSVQGGFFHNTATGGPLGGSNLPAAIGGVFAISGSGYGANGIMVGARR